MSTIQKNKKISKNHNLAISKLQSRIGNENELSSIQDAIEHIKAVKYAKFDETLNITMLLGIDPKRHDQNVRGVVDMPAGTGKKVRVAVLVDSSKEQEAQNAGADLYSSSQILDEIKRGELNFDTLIATPNFMPQLTQHARTLGPKGLMPNPKVGTVTMDVVGAIRKAKAGQVEYRANKNANILAGIGKLSFSTDDLVKNCEAIIDAVRKAQPAGIKGSYMKKIYLNSTSTPSVQISLSAFDSNAGKKKKH